VSKPSPVPARRAELSIVPFDEPAAASAPAAARASPSLLDTLPQDALAGAITGLLAIPLSVGICLMSDYPVKRGLATVVVACLVSFAVYRFRPGNHVGVPGVAAGLAPVLALGVHQFGFERMPFLILLTSLFQMVVWHNRWEKYLLKAVPPFLIEGLLAGVGAKIVMKFLPYTWAVAGDAHGPFWVPERVTVIAASAGACWLFLHLYRRFHDTNPGMPYLATIGVSVWVGAHAKVPMLTVADVPLTLKWPVPDLATIPPATLAHMALFALMLALVDVIEQVMSNAAIEKIDPLGRKSDSNNSLLVMWMANLTASFFGGMTNLDGLAKSSTNRMAGALTKTSCLFVALVIGVVLAYPSLLSVLPEFSLAVLMVFTGWKMIAGLYHVAAEGQYAFGLSLFCGILVFRLGIFEGLAIALLVHSFIVYVVYKHDKVPTLEILRKFIQVFSDGAHPHATELMAVNEDPHTGGLTYSSVTRVPAEKKSLDAFIEDWATGINSHNLLSVVGTYDHHGLLWGTFAKDLRAGHIHIKRYFEHLFELDQVKVRFESGETRQYHDIFIRSGTYRFSYVKKQQPVVVPARYSFVCKKERTGWYILEHHSSEFPN
jgi:MFS superfamily sulfate permease-like transporter